MIFKIELDSPYRDFVSQDMNRLSEWTIEEDHFLMNIDEKDSPQFDNAVFLDAVLPTIQKFHLIMLEQKHDKDDLGRKIGTVLAPTGWSFPIFSLYRKNT